LGATGSGKTTFINFMTNSDTEDMIEDSFGSNMDSVTRQNDDMLYESGTIKYENKRFEFKFLDSVGFDAHDMKDENLFTDITKKIILMGDSRVNGIILIHKMDRCRSNFDQDIKKILLMFELFGLRKDQILIIVTHVTLHNKKTREKYIIQLNQKLKDVIIPDNIITVEFFKHSELNEEFLKYHEGIFQEEFNKVVARLIKFNNTFNPNKYLLENIDLEKKISIDLGERDEI